MSSWIHAKSIKAAQFRIKTWDGNSVIRSVCIINSFYIYNIKEYEWKLNTHWLNVALVKKLGFMLTISAQSCWHTWNDLDWSLMNQNVSLEYGLSDRLLMPSNGNFFISSTHLTCVLVETALKMKNWATIFCVVKICLVYKWSDN